jgi:4-alpha-glucanotransferase
VLGVNLPRCSGILLHATSLPSSFGIGDFGPEAYCFADQLAAARQTLWQVLPLGPAGDGDSPYQSYSAFAGDPLFISPELLVREGVLSADDLKIAPQFPPRTVDYESVRLWKLPLLTQAYRTFRDSAAEASRHAFDEFCADHAAWLEDYALFVALRNRFGPQKSWTCWEKNVVVRNPGTLASYREELADEVNCQKYWQFLFYRQWDDLRQYCRARGVRIVGDIPIYVALNSADVWAHPEQFLLDENRQAKAVSGVPPDYFSETGQLWGNPIYNWREMERSGFHWWIERFRGTFRLFDIVRVDHFRGFQAYWEIPAGEKTAVNGKWVNAPGEKLFHAVSFELGALDIIAENLGVITPEVEALRKKFHLPGMAILQFAFGIEGNAASYRPHNLERDLIAYTGTHDNDTIMGWWNSCGGDSTRSEEDVRQEKEFTLNYLGPGDEPMNWRCIRAIAGSVARVAVAPMQDVLGLGNEARMNRPGTATGNWRWRLLPGEFAPELQERLHNLAAIYDRVPT